LLRNIPVLVEGEDSKASLWCRLLCQLLQVCGKGPATTPQKLAAALFDGLSDSQPQTVQGAFKSCSYGNADFSKDSGVQVLTVTVPIPCKGSTPWNLPYDSSTCPYVGEYACTTDLIC
jgi:hypothetical protein